MIPIQDTIPRRHPPIAVWALVALNALVFLAELRMPPQTLEGFFYLFGLVPARLTHPAWARSVGFPAHEVWPFFTCMFLHAGWLHIIGNMWVLWLFGDNVEDVMGPARFLIFYVLCGLAASGVQWATHQDSTMPTVGASGAIAGVMGAYLLLYPRARIVVLVPVLFLPLFFVVPAVFFLVFWFLLQFVSGAAELARPGNVGGVAWWAHVGGFLTGMVLMPLFLRPRASRRRIEPDEHGIPGAWHGSPSWR